MPDEKSSTEVVDSVDQILNAEDPEFAKGLGALRVETVDPLEAIESLTNLEEDSLPLDPHLDMKPARGPRFLNRLKTQIQLKWIDLKLVLRTLPKELLNYSLIQLRGLAQQLGLVIRNWRALSVWQKSIMICAGILAVAAIRLVEMNLRGQWIPSWRTEFLSNYEAVADKVIEFQPSDLVLLRTALPQPEFQVLLDKFVVNLKRRPGVIENPMGTFEMYIGVDSKDAAIEIRARQKELIDRVSRAVEDLTYPEATGELGSEKIKTVVKDALNKELSQGFVTRVYFRTNITKP
jgi:flagellar basal body-associated protein FliL